MGKEKEGEGREGRGRGKRWTGRRRAAYGDGKGEAERAVVAEVVSEGEEAVITRSGDHLDLNSA